MKREWTDRDGERWHVRAYNSGGAMAIGDQIPDAGKDMNKVPTPRLLGELLHRDPGPSVPRRDDRRGPPGAAGPGEGDRGTGGRVRAWPTIETRS